MHTYRPIDASLEHRDPLLALLVPRLAIRAATAAGPGLGVPADESTKHDRNKMQDAHNRNHAMSPTSA